MSFASPLRVLLLPAVLWLVLSLALAGGSLAPLAPASAQTAPVAPALPAASPEVALRHVTALSRTIGPRPAGQPGFLRAVEYMEAQLRALNYEVERQPFTFTHFEARTVTLRVADGDGEALRPTVLQFSGSTPPGGLDGILTHAGSGQPDDVRRATLAGRIALIERGGLTFQAKAENAAAAGAIAVIVYNNRPGSITGGTLVAPSRIPAVAISQEEGERLLALLSRGEVRVRLQVETRIDERTTWNVVGRRTGRDARRLVIGAHLDSVPASPGANDNASGIAAALETARVLARVQLPMTVEIIGFGAEELGLFGSAHYARERGRGVAGMVNMDMVGRGPLHVGHAGRTHDRLVELAAAIAGRLNLRVERFRLGSSDHVSFEQAGIPTVFIHTGDDPEIHTPRDVVERIDPQRIAQAAQLAAQLALEAADVLR